MYDTLAKKWNKINLYATATTTGIPELAEQPPADMAAMLRPPEKPPPDVTAVDSIEETIDVQQESLPSPRLNTVTSLWTLASTTSSVYSSLFGGVKLGFIKPPENRNTISTPQSALFGRAMPLANSQNSFASPLDRFAEVVERIHSTLVIAPSSLKASIQHAADTTQASSVEQSTTMDTEEDILPSSAQVEMPFVPASQRAIKSRAGSTVDDAIVMVGQTRRKKRKRTKDAKSGDGTPKTENEDEETAPFDFDSAPNILDDAPAAEQSAIPRKKAKQAKAGGRGFYGDFPAPPKAHSELKSGNKSHTFK
ncbi:hypothetical protein BT96DRAFT_986444 [Gymnopus androsaceus JB14]|uniref:Uncharacterized protein n=1 Tax=Gymnopus androsaceus JB14 TaxID=1447944 RepID=A0A6A4IGB7_9AGAR|nr:hypothetical protein BT96DRAFT_986444 [Gymnopus androsaceus JB14]